MNEIYDVVSGVGYNIRRRIPGVPPGEAILSLTLIVKDQESTDDILAHVNKVITTTSTPHGVVSDNGTISSVGDAEFILIPSETSLFPINKTVYYQIRLTASFITGTNVIEEGTIYTNKESTDVTKALATSARSSFTTQTSRISRIIDGYLDTILHDFRQLRVWDEHARRSGNDPLLFRTTYENWNPNFTPEIFDGQNNRISINNMRINYDKGTFLVTGDDVSQDYFITYEFNLFPPEQLAALLDLTLMEINSSAEPGTHLTAYSSVANAPIYWDGPLTAGTAAKCFKRLSSDGSLWRNYLIWQEGNNGQQIADETSNYYQTLYDDLRKSVKRTHHTARPTQAYEFFRNSGFGFMNPGSERFREMSINRISFY